MKKTILLVLIVSLFAACKSAPPVPPPPAEENPNVGPGLQVVIPELFNPDPDIVDDVITISIAVSHPVDIKDWSITIHPDRQRVQTANPEGQTTTRQRANQGQRRRFFEATGTGTPPAQFAWDGKSTSRPGEMVQSATDYQFILAVNDIYGNSTTHEGLITVGIIVRREGDNLRIVVPAISFQADRSNFTQPASDLTEEQIRANRMVIGRIANALNRYPDYKITIEGHANPIHASGTAQHRNYEPTLRTLSEQRARAVGEFLVQNHNIDETRLSFVGMGSTKTVVDFRDDEDEKWKNRRVEFLLQK